MLQQFCKCHNGDEALYYKDNDNCAFIDNKGEMLVIVKGHTMRFNVNFCPKCGHVFILDKLQEGATFYYVDDTMKFPDEIIQGKVDTIYPNKEYFEAHYYVDNSDEYEAVRADEWGVFFFPDKESALNQLSNFLDGNFVYD